MVKEFAEELREVILDTIHDDNLVEIEIQEVTKNNDNVLTALVFKTESNIAPVIYVNQAYEAYSSGEPIEKIASNIMDTYLRAQFDCPTNVEAYTDFEKVKDNLIVCAINTRMNSDTLEKMPHIDVQDVSLICRLLVKADDDGVATVKVDNALFEAYGVSKEELFEQAWDSMKANHPMMVKDMLDILKEVHPDIPDEVFAPMNKHRGEMYVVQSDTLIHGAGYGFDKESLSQICDQLDSNGIYVLPSSINEVIVIPENKVDDVNHLVDVVCQVNEESVPDEEYLSNNAYHFDNDTQELTVVSNQAEMDMKM